MKLGAPREPVCSYNSKGYRSLHERETNLSTQHCYDPSLSGETAGVHYSLPPRPTLGGPHHQLQGEGEAGPEQQRRPHHTQPQHAFPHSRLLIPHHPRIRPDPAHTIAYNGKSNDAEIVNWGWTDRLVTSDRRLPACNSTDCKLKSDLCLSIILEMQTETHIEDKHGIYSQFRMDLLVAPVGLEHHYWKVKITCKLVLWFLLFKSIKKQLTSNRVSDLDLPLPPNMRWYWLLWKLILVGVQHKIWSMN